MVVVNGRGETVYAMKSKDAPGNNADEKGISAAEKQKRGNQKGSLSAEQMTSLQSELDRTGVTMETVQERYRIQEPGNMGEDLYKKVMA